jgi:predicted RNase H-like nuclease (RuvC/YqgF family)
LRELKKSDLSATIERALSARRRNRDRSSGPSADRLASKTLEFEARLSRVELACADLARSLETMRRKNAALEAELDHLRAKMALS